MITIYGIPTCGSVKKAIAYLKARGIEHTLVNFRKTPVDAAKIAQWVQKAGIDTLFNNRGTQYRTLGLAQKNLSNVDKEAWLAQENMLIKRPVIELESGSVLVGYDESIYQKHF